jgi:hypothetical protein
MRQTDWTWCQTQVLLSRCSRTCASTSSWRASQTPLRPDEQQTLRDLWHTTLHLLSFLNFQEARLRELFQHFLPAPRRGEGSPLAPPWSGTTLRAFLETGGAEAISQVDRWVTGLRFGDPYAA